MEARRQRGFGLAPQTLPGKAGALGSPLLSPRPQALQPVVKPADDPEPAGNGKVVEPALVDPPKPRADSPHVVAPALARDPDDTRQ